jgi:hypothetical protein
MYIRLPMLVCLSARTSQIDNHWMNLDEIWYKHYAIEV